MLLMLMLDTAILIKWPTSRSQNTMSEAKTSQVDAGKKVDNAVKWVRQENRSTG